MHSPTARSCRSVSPAFLALLTFASLVLLVATVVMPQEASAAGDRAAVTTSFLVRDGDTGAPLPGITVTFANAAGSQIGQGVSDATGLITLSGVDEGATVTAYAAEGRGYLAFPVTATATASGPVAIPLYRASTQWTTWGMSAARLHVGPAVRLPAGTTAASARWTFDAGNMLEFPPSVAYGMVLYGSYHGFINFNRAADGALVFQRYIASKFANQCATTTWVEGSGPLAKRVARVYFAALNGKVWCLDAFTGAEIWSRDSGAVGGVTRAFKSFEASPLVVGERLYLATRYNKNGGKAGVWALNRRTGAVLWYRQLGTKPGSKIAASPAFAGGRLFAATYDGIVYALNPGTGKVVWKSKVGGSLYSSPAVAGTRLFIGNKTTKVLTCLSVKNGKKLWQTKLGNPVYSSPAVWNGRVFVGSGKRVFALKAANGKVIWKKSTAGKVIGSASVLKGVVYFSDFSGRTRGYSASSGKTVWTFNDGRYSPVTATGGTIVVVGTRTVYAFTPAP